MKRSRAGTQWFLTYRDLGPPSLRKGQGAEKKGSKEKKRKPQPDWDETIHDLSKFKLTEEELEDRRQAAVSKNLIQVPRSAVENWVPQFGYDERGRFHDHIAGPRLVSEEHSFASLRQQGKLQPWRPAGTPNFLEQLERPRIQPWHHSRQQKGEDEASQSEQQEDKSQGQEERAAAKTTGGAVDFDEEVLRFEAKQRLIQSLQKGKKAGAHMQGASKRIAQEEQSPAKDEDPLTSLERGFADLEVRLDRHAPARLRHDSCGSSHALLAENESAEGKEARTAWQEGTSSGEGKESQGQGKHESKGGPRETEEARTACPERNVKSNVVGESSRQDQRPNESHQVPLSAETTRTYDQGQNGPQVTESEAPASDRGVAGQAKEGERAAPNAQEEHHGLSTRAGGVEKKDDSDSVTSQRVVADASQKNDNAVQQSHPATAAKSLAEAPSAPDSGNKKSSHEAPGEQPGQQQRSTRVGVASRSSQEAPRERSGQQQRASVSTAGPGVAVLGSPEAPGETTGQQQTATASTAGPGVAIPGRRPAVVERTAPASNSKPEWQRPVMPLDAMAHLEKLSQGLQTCLAQNRSLQSDFNEFKSHASSILTGLQLHVQKLLEVVPPRSSHVASSYLPDRSGGSADLARDISLPAGASSNPPRPFELQLPALEEDLVDSIPLPSYAELKSLNRPPEMVRAEQKRPRRSETIRTSMGLEPVPRSLPANLRVSLRNAHASR